MRIRTKHEAVPYTRILINFVGAGRPVPARRVTERRTYVCTLNIITAYFFLCII